ncbi:hemerythrin domain-containing protein [Candidatus Manganitrophus noduliformans]|uniref:Hemerythrin n=1 Tax=Candidatus Manganitrophus noduliformans TaxID=2606439 RepID=A0A7X6DSM3_9BACT|nr:hemerythrin domain-containing protein [Candidatus Manganitrophus noduliformans]NKE72657.1 hemerythrin [Candidatus Manganitrophus noduliformans]
MKPTDQLKKEHEAILLLLRVLDKVAARLEAGERVDATDLDRMLEFIRIFADRCHHGKEETFLFPALEEAGMPREGGPVGVMLQEHDQGRRYVEALSKAVAGYQADDPEAAASFAASARSYIQHLTQHIEKENHILFPMADRFLSDGKQKALLNAFDRIEEEVVGKGKHEEFHLLLDHLSEVYLK